MFFLLLALVALISLGIAAVRREPLRAIGSCRFSAPGVLYVAIAARLLFIPPALEPLLAARPIPGWLSVGAVLYVGSLLLLVVFTWHNRRLPGLTLMLTGLGLNFLAIALNGGQMPGDPEVLAQAGWLEQTLREQETGRWSTFTVLTEQSRLPWLTDRYLVPLPFRRPIVLSVGDFVIALGAFCFFNQIRFPRRQKSPGGIGA